MRADFADNADISHIPSTFRWDVTEADYTKSVCSCNALLLRTFVATPNSLAEASHFVCVGPFPDVLEFRVTAEFAVFHRLACFFIRDGAGQRFQELAGVSTTGGLGRCDGVFAVEGNRHNMALGWKR